MKGKSAISVISPNLCLLLELDVQKAKSWPPLAVAELIFLLLRGADAVHDEAQISTLLTATIRAVQSVLNVRKVFFCFYSFVILRWLIAKRQWSH